MRVFPMFFAVILASPVLAQTQTRVFLTDGNPTRGTTNTFPWSQATVRYQTIFPAALFKNMPWLINDILVAPGLAMLPTRRTAIWPDIEIRIGQTAQATIARNWTTNNPKPGLVWRGALRCDFELGKWRGLGLPKPFQYIPLPATPNVCVEIIIWKIDPNTVPIRAVADSGTQRAFRNNWTNSKLGPLVGGSAAKMGLVLSSPNFVDVGVGCKGSSNSVPTLGATNLPQIGGKPFNLTMSGGLPSSVGIMVLGIDRTKLGAIPLPFDLQPLGATGCLVWNDLLVTLGVPLDAKGAANFPLPLPAFLISGQRLYFHWWNLDANANTFGLTTSNLGAALLSR